MFSNKRLFSTQLAASCAIQPYLHKREVSFSVKMPVFEEIVESDVGVWMIYETKTNLTNIYRLFFRKRMTS